jgi:hypothetical protein
LLQKGGVRAALFPHLFSCQIITFVMLGVGETPKSSESAGCAQDDSGICVYGAPAFMHHRVH